MSPTTSVISDYDMLNILGNIGEHRVWKTLKNIGHGRILENIRHWRTSGTGEHQGRSLCNEEHAAYERWAPDEMSLSKCLNIFGGERLEISCRWFLSEDFSMKILKWRFFSKESLPKTSLRLLTENSVESRTSRLSEMLSDYKLNSLPMF